MARAVLRIVSNLTNVLSDHRFSTDALLCAFEQLEVTLYRGLARMKRPEILIHLCNGFDIQNYWVTIVNCPYIESD